MSSLNKACQAGFHGIIIGSTRLTTFIIKSKAG
ncbi:hypothetical protein YPC_1411 [Yersinia pestis biovar Medievalis str. Harbin 35]|nr:hypothetical protein YPC_1411 [Yersinia pestis biovar Medievalis str. Harbin 35]EEO76826.1 hypothetical protein YP516_1553 [Yersinia pestis Nepal516]EEO79613.1 hypothetical protein YPF_3592 [Yersinia pestis biovar Orientalis str. India 195]EEO84985.1 hypothetical protein YPH_0814 [Yersinia pestis biovar Orientalis str. PEXU2]EEO89474.1 hypothetical protein YPS_3432 [Yersinia pestis Pestoides A]